MLIVLGCALLVLAAGMVVLFAMFGELSARVDEAGMVRRSTEVRVLEKARLGQVPQSWPPSLPGPGDGTFTLLVLSSACGSCADIATQLTTDPGHADWAGMGVAVSTAHRDTGADFVDRHGLARVPHYVDEGGDWVSGEFDVRFSPSALVFRGGMLAEAYMFHDVAALRATLDQAPALGRHESGKEAAWPERAT
jgi:hypothetical protein